MKVVSLPLRTAFFNKLNSGITYLGKSIFTFEDYLQETSTRKKAILQVGTMTVEAYIILLNQTENDNSNKCRKNDQASIQVQINTIFPSGKGGSQQAEEIGNLVYEKLFPVNNLKADIILPTPFHCWKSVKQGARNLNYDTETSRAWIHQITFNNWISQS